MFQSVPGFAVMNNNANMCRDAAKLVHWILTYGQVNLQCKTIDYIQSEVCLLILKIVILKIRK